MNLPTQFSTIGVPQERRITLWEQYNAEAYVGLRARVPGGAPLVTAETNFQFGHVQLAQVHGGPQVVDRGPSVVKEMPADAVALFFILSGESAFQQGSNAWKVARPGQLLMCDLDQPFECVCAHGVFHVNIKVPRSVFRRLGGTPPAEPQVIDFYRSSRPDAYAKALGSLVGKAVAHHTQQRPGDGIKKSAPSDEDALLDLLAALSESDPSARADSAHWAASKAYVQRQLRNPDLSAAHIARGIGISERHLSRVFADAGTSVPRYVLHRRIELAQRLLNDPGHSQTPIAEIAGMAGFSSEAYFSRAFRRTTGLRPRDARRNSAYSARFDSDNSI